jgi:hypothetical protein
VIDALRVTRSAGGAPPGEPRSPACLNCGTPLTGPYCPQCGQRDIPPYPSVRELVVDAFWELSGWDGRFAATVRALIRHPGMLTREFLEGRRARYLSPLRLYLMASLAYFVIAAAVPESPNHNNGELAVSVGPTAKPAATSAPQRVGDAVSKSLNARAGDPDPDPDPDLGKSKAPLTPEQKAAALKDVERAPAIMRPLMRRAIQDPTGLKRGILESMPRMLFVLLPIFAAILALFYRGRRYPEHLYFAIHLHSFVFLALAIAAIAKFTRFQPVIGVVGAGAALWILIYATLALRRAYGGGIAKTIAKEFGIATIYSIVSIVAFLLTIYFVALYG